MSAFAADEFISEVLKTRVADAQAATTIPFVVKTIINRQAERTRIRRSLAERLVGEVIAFQRTDSIATKPAPQTTAPGKVKAFDCIHAAAEKPVESEATSHQVDWKNPQATFDYTDLDGNLLYQNVRYRILNSDGTPVISPKGKPEKTFRQRRTEGTRWISDLSSVAKVPYKLADLVAALAADRTIPVLIVEGELKVDVLHALHIPATHIAKGTKDYAEFFRDADVVLVPDNDEAGYRHIKEIGSALFGTAKRIRVLALPGLENGYDVEDWVNAGGTGEQLWELIEEAQDWQPPRAAPPASEAPRTFGKSEVGPRERDYAQKALDGAYSDLVALSDDRNNQLNNKALHLGTMVGAGWIERGQVKRRLEEACLANGEWKRKGARQCRDTIKSGIEAGVLRPPPVLKNDDSDTIRVEILDDGTRINAETGEPLGAADVNKADAETDYHATLEKLSRTDGLIGELTELTVETAIKPKRVMALLASVTVIGTLIGRRIATPVQSGGTHLYGVCLDDTAGGKQHVINATRHYLLSAEAPHLIGPGEFTGGPALVDWLKEYPIGLSCMDEFGSFIGRINANGSSGWERQFLKIMRELWGINFNCYSGMRWAKHKCDPIWAPAISLIGFSTPGQFWRAFNSDNLEEGTINRFIIVEEPDVFVESRTPTRGLRDISETLQENLKYLHDPDRDGKWPVDAIRGNYNPEPKALQWGTVRKGDGRSTAAISNSAFSKTSRWGGILAAPRRMSFGWPRFTPSVGILATHWSEWNSQTSNGPSSSST